MEAEVQEIKIIIEYHPDYEWLKERCPEEYPFLANVEVYAKKRRTYLCSVHYDANQKYSYSALFHNHSINFVPLKRKDVLEKTKYHLCGENPIDRDLWKVPVELTQQALEIGRKKYEELLLKSYLE